jgi:hypothetical protein
MKRLFDPFAALRVASDSWASAAILDGVGKSGQGWGVDGPMVEHRQAQME